MKKNWLQNALVLSAIAGLLVLAGCDEVVEDQILVLGAPANVTIAVEGRTMTVSWDAVNGAQGYELYTTSVGCGSVNRQINTKDITAYSYTKEEGVGNISYLKSDKSNGAVAILAKNKIEITLMPAMGDNTKPMATKVTAKVRALGGEAGGINYLNSKYSAEEEKPLGSGMGG